MPVQGVHFTFFTFLGKGVKEELLGNCVACDDDTDLMITNDYRHIYIVLYYKQLLLISGLVKLLTSAP